MRSTEGSYPLHLFEEEMRSTIQLAAAETKALKPGDCENRKLPNTTSCGRDQSIEARGL